MLVIRWSDWSKAEIDQVTVLECPLVCIFCILHVMSCTYPSPACIALARTTLVPLKVPLTTKFASFTQTARDVDQGYKLIIRQVGAIVEGRRIAACGYHSQALGTADSAELDSVCARPASWM